jgi:hypothetical protein
MRGNVTDLYYGHNLFTWKFHNCKINRRKKVYLLIQSNKTNGFRLKQCGIGTDQLSTHNKSKLEVDTFHTKTQAFLIVCSYQL